VVVDAYFSDAVGGLPAQPNPAFRYLKVDVAGHPSALLVLGYVESSPLGPIEVWYSANREVLKISNGRVVATAGLQADWRNVQFTGLPLDWDWALANTPNATNSQKYERVRDAMPGYRFGIREQLAARVATPPAKALPTVAVPGAMWVEESVQGPPGSDLPSAWFAVRAASTHGRAEVLASYQCLTASLCMRLQPWPVASAAAPVSAP
jgi:hypothetical protein